MRFIYFLLTLFFFIFFSCKVSKKQSTTTHQPESGSDAKSNTLLWKVSGKDLQQPSYILGTMHLLCANDAVLSDSLKLVLEKVDKIYFELDMDNMLEMLGGMSKMMMKNDTTLQQLLSAAEYDKVKQYFSKSNSMIPFSMLEKMQPMLTSSTLMEDEMKCEGGVSGTEMRIMDYNKTGKKKEIDGLEKVSDQLKVFENIPYQEQAKMLLEYVTDINKTKGETQKMVNAFKSQNLDSIEALINKSEPAMEKYMDVLLVNRNKNWIEQFKTIFPKTTIIAAVGAGHLVGKDGVLNLLRKEGYTVTPVTN